MINAASRRSLVRWSLSRCHCRLYARRGRAHSSVSAARRPHTKQTCFSHSSQHDEPTHTTGALSAFQLRTASTSTRPDVSIDEHPEQLSAVVKKPNGAYKTTIKEVNSLQWTLRQFNRYDLLDTRGEDKRSSVVGTFNEHVGSVASKPWRWTAGALGSRDEVSQAHVSTQRTPGTNAVVVSTRQNKVGYLNILSRQIYHTLAGNEADSEHYQTALNESEAEFVRRHGYTSEDVSAWVSFLLQPNASLAVSALQDRIESSGLHAYPLPVVVFFLRRRDIPAAPLSALIHTLRQLLASKNLNGPSFGATVIFQIFKRLLRHARKTSAHAYESVTSTLLENLPKPTDLSTQQTRELNSILNTALALLSRPTKHHSFRSAHSQKNALVQILEHMDDPAAALKVTRSGYQAMARTQLRQPKTQAERTWTELQAQSWPPWKQDRTGIDSFITPDHGISQAGQSLQRMNEAGFTRGNWEQVARILSGWDEDGTPTVQTRSTIGSVPHGRLTRASPHWAARIAITRTMQEAWAQWLTYESTLEGHPPAQSVLLAVFKKLHQERMRNASRSPRQTQNLPGDSRDMRGPPDSAHLHTYTKTAPPTMHQFFEHLQTKNVTISLRCLSYIIAYADSIQDGFAYVQAYEQQYIKTIAVMLGHPSQGEADDMLMTAIARLFCRFTDVPIRQLPTYYSFHSPNDQLIMPVHLKQWEMRSHHSFRRALWLVQNLTTREVQPWLCLFECLAKPTRMTAMHITRVLNATSSAVHLENTASKQAEIKQNFARVLSFRFAEQIYEMMVAKSIRPTFEIFHQLCVLVQSYGQALRSIGRALSGLSDDDVLNSWYTTSGLSAEALSVGRETPVLFLRSAFQSMLGINPGPLHETNMNVSLATIATIDPANLHAWIRALGSLGNHAELLQLTRLICTEKMLEVYLESEAKLELVRRCMIALRVFLERSWLDQDTKRAPTGVWAECMQGIESKAPDETIDEIKSLVEKKFGPELGSWASSKEVEAYCQDSSFTSAK